MKFLKLNSLSTLLGLPAMVFLFACGNSNEAGQMAEEGHMHDEAAHDGHAHDGHSHDGEAMQSASGDMMDFTAQTPAAFQQQFGQYAEDYQELKDALVDTDFEAAKTAASETLSSLEGVDMAQLEGEAHDYWMQQHKMMQQHLQAMADASEIEEIRKHFAELTQPMKQSIAAYGVPGETFYVQYCPMAFNDQGASWISSEEAIRNPYFGDKMLKCGKVQETLATK
jgi:Cu(I)/Ag(I) efflux system membrane fusion protein